MAEIEQQAADIERAEVISVKRPQRLKYVPRNEGTRKKLSDVLNRNTNESGCIAVSPTYKPKETPPTKSPSATELLAKAGDLLASAMTWRGTVSKKETPSEPSNKNTSGLKH